MDNTRYIAYEADSIFYASPAISDFLSVSDWKYLRRTCSFFYNQSLKKEVATRMSFLFQYTGKHRTLENITGFISSIPTLNHFRGAKVTLNLRHVTGCLQPESSNAGIRQLRRLPAGGGILRVQRPAISTANTSATGTIGPNNTSTIATTKVVIELPNNLTDLSIEDSDLSRTILDLTSIVDPQRVSLFGCTFPSDMIWNNSIKDLKIDSCGISRGIYLQPHENNKMAETNNGRGDDAGRGDTNETTTNNVPVDINFHNMHGMERLELAEAVIGDGQLDLLPVGIGDTESGLLRLLSTRQLHFPDNLRHLVLRDVTVEANIFDLSNLTLIKSLDLYKLNLPDICCAVLPANVERVAIESCNAPVLIDRLRACTSLKTLRMVGQQITGISSDFISNGVEDLTLNNCKYIGQLLCFRSSNIKRFSLGGLNTEDNSVRIIAGRSLIKLKVSNSSLNALCLNLSEASNLSDIDFFNVETNYDMELPSNLQHLKLEDCRYTGADIRRDGPPTSTSRSPQLPILKTVKLVNTDPKLVLHKYFGSTSIQKLHLEKCDVIASQRFLMAYIALISLSLIGVMLPEHEEEDTCPFVLPPSVQDLNIKDCRFRDHYIEDTGHFLRYFDFADIEEVKSKSLLINE